jgi:hypothetical protein
MRSGSLRRGWSRRGRPRRSVRPDGLIDNWTSGPTPRQPPDQLAEFAKGAEAGLNHEVDSVVRWRRIDLKHVIPTNSSSSFMGSPIQTVDISALGVDAQGTAGVDVKRTLRMTDGDVAVADCGPTSLPRLWNDRSGTKGVIP